MMVIIMMLTIYKKNLRKNWIINILPPFIIVTFVLLIASSWSSMKDIIIDRLATMNNPIMVAILGDLGVEGIDNVFMASIFMYAGGTANLVILFAAILIPSRLLSEEIDKNVLDVILSYPILRWRYLLDKFLVYLTYSLSYPIIVFITMMGSAAINNENMDISLVLNYSISLWFLLFAVGSVSLLMTSIFLDSNRSLAAAGLVAIGQYFLDSLGGIIPALQDLQFLSLFHYLKLGAILNEGMIPLNELFIISFVGFFATLLALWIFDHREFTN